MKRALVSWSGGKDCAWAFQHCRANFDITALLVTVSAADSSVPIHNVPVQRLRSQAEALDFPLIEVQIPQPCPNAAYVERFRVALADAKSDFSIEAVIFGDLFLSDIRAFREGLLTGTGVTPIFPLWGAPTGPLAREMIAGGLEATVCAAQDPALVGRAFDHSFLASLATDTDPCGENGEFHTFVNFMPGFKSRVAL